MAGKKLNKNVWGDRKRTRGKSDVTKAGKIEHVKKEEIGQRGQMLPRGQLGLAFGKLGHPCRKIV